MKRLDRRNQRASIGTRARKGTWMELENDGKYAAEEEKMGKGLMGETKDGVEEKEVDRAGRKLETGEYVMWRKQEKL